MKRQKVIPEIENLLNREGVITVEDFVSACPEIPKPTVYARIRKLVNNGKIQIVGRGRYIAVTQPHYRVDITSWMREVNAALVSKCVGVNSCISMHKENLLVEVHKSDIGLVMSCLKGEYEKVVLKKDVDRFPGKIEGYIMVAPLVVEAPVLNDNGIVVPTLEKTLVDSILDGNAKNAFRRAFDVYPVNISRLKRYASRRGMTEEVDLCLSVLDKDRIRMFYDVRNYLSSLPVSKAWVFGSFARGEEKPESDLDLLISYDKNANVSLLTIIRWKLDIEKIVGRDVDLVEEGYLRPFAAESANKDKYLIYERRHINCRENSLQ